MKFTLLSRLVLGHATAFLPGAMPCAVILVLEEEECPEDDVGSQCERVENCNQTVVHRNFLISKQWGAFKKRTCCNEQTILKALGDGLLTC